MTVMIRHATSDGRCRAVANRWLCTRRAVFLVSESLALLAPSSKIVIFTEALARRSGVTNLERAALPGGTSMVVDLTNGAHSKAPEDRRTPRRWRGFSGRWPRTRRAVFPG